MKKSQHIMNKLKEDSDDLIICRNIQMSINVLNELNISYSVLGSCGLQSYLNYFVRLPNDLDVVIDYEELSKIKEYCLSNDYEFIEQLGRSKASLNELPIHLIPSKLNCIEKIENKIFTKIDLTEFIALSELRSINLLNSNIHPQLKVFSLEVILFVELVRPIYTGSLISIYFSLSQNEIDYKLFKRLFDSHEDLKDIILYRLKEYLDKIIHLDCFEEKTLNKAISRLTNIYDQVTKT